LLEWVKANSNKEANGFTNHIWNGVTCLELAKVMHKIIKGNLYWKGTKHIYSPEHINKADLVQLISDVFELNITVIPIVTVKPPLCDRRLRSFDHYSSYLLKNIPSLKDQLIELKTYSDLFKQSVLTKSN
jgi:dTDP-4-dehydrorhamnose reductase